jgi:hypothetical protein
MRDDLKKLYKDQNDIFGQPQIYKGIKLYPILLKDLDMQDMFYKVFARPKNYIPNVEILKTTYLKFLIYALSDAFGPNGDEVVNGIVNILKYITKEDNVEILFKKTDGVGFDSIKLALMVGETQLTEDDFASMREIILEQNNLSIEYVESYNPELEVHLEFINRNVADISLQDQIFTFCAIMKIALSEVEKYTLYQFSNLMEKLLTLKEYDLYKPLLASGQITLKSGDDIKHFLYHSKKSGRYDSVLVGVDAFMEKNKDTFNGI